MILIKTTIIEDKPFDVTTRAWPKMMRAAHAKAGAWWHKRVFPQHFEYSAKTKYKHQKRTNKYLNRKKWLARMGRPDRRGGAIVIPPGSIDNVFTGEMKKALTASVTIRSFPTRASVKMQGPVYALMRPYKINQPNKGRELTATTQDERDTMGAMIKDEVERQLKAFRARRTTHI